MKNPDQEEDPRAIQSVFRAVDTLLKNESVLQDHKDLVAWDRLETLKDKLFEKWVVIYERNSGKTVDKAVENMFKSDHIGIGNGKPIVFGELITVPGKPVSEIIIEERRGSD